MQSKGYIRSAEVGGRIRGRDQKITVHAGNKETGDKEIQYM
jgi:hypothetical protein